MSLAAWVTMAAICAVVWGGFLGFLTLAVRREGAKQRAARGH